ncbi:MAG: hypothetical protein Kow0031_13840 [Anaerolineae bacterium]
MTDDAVFTGKPLRFALKGMIAVHYLDGEVVEGVFAAQDAYNIFITVSNEPVMIPRQQIRYIKGLAGQGIEPDTSLEEAAGEPEEVPAEEPAGEDAPTQVPVPPPHIVVTQPLPDAPDVTASPSGPVPPPLPVPADEADDAEEFDGTMILMPDQDEAVYDIGEEEAEDDEDEDDGTMIIPPGAHQPVQQVDDSPLDTSHSMPSVIPTDDEPINLDEELDLTVVLGNADQPDLLDMDADEKTVALGLDESKELSAALTCINGPHVGEVYPLNAGITTVGRSSDNVIVLFKDKEISRHHAIVLFESDRFVVQDQNSLNGTFVNDEQISGPRYLEDGDVIMVGVSYLKYEVT